MTGACANAGSAPLDFLDEGIIPDAERPELSILSDGSVAQRYIVQVRPDLFVDGFLSDVVVNLASRHDLHLERFYDAVYGGFAVALRDDEVAALRAHPEVASIVKDTPAYAVKGPPGPPPPPPPPPAADWAIKDVLGADFATRENQQTGVGALVVVLDSGVDSDHVDLPAVACLGDFTNTTGDCEDGNGHGTHVSGTISAQGVAHRGVAPAVSLAAGKVLNASGSGSIAGIIAGINAAAADGYDVINMSLGAQAFGPESQDPLCAAITDATTLGTLSVVAAGNNGANAANFTPSRCDNALTVAAYDVTGKLASFTNTGSDVDLAAPGVAISSTTMDGAYGVKSGTSMAAPHVAAVAALFIASNPGATPASTKAGVIANSLNRGAPTAYSKKITVAATVYKVDGSAYQLLPPPPPPEG